MRGTLVTEITDTGLITNRKMLTLRLLGPYISICCLHGSCSIGSFCCYISLALPLVDTLTDSLCFSVTVLFMLSVML